MSIACLVKLSTPADGRGSNLVMLLSDTPFLILMDL